MVRFSLWTAGMMWLVVAGVAGWACGEGLRRQLNRLTYRLGPEAAGSGTSAKAAGSGEPAAEVAPTSQSSAHIAPAQVTSAQVAPEPIHPSANHDDDPAETALPAPGARHWIPVVLALTWMGVFWALSVNPVAPTIWLDLRPATLTAWIELLAWVGFSAVGMWMAVIDFDVRRLPDRGQTLLAAITVGAGIVLAWGSPVQLLTGLGSAVVCGLGFLIMNILSRGGVGLGDVKLVAICGWWLGLSSVTAVFAALLAACLLGLLHAAVTGSRQFAFGPWLIAGTLIGGLAF